MTRCFFATALVLGLAASGMAAPAPALRGVDGAVHQPLASGAGRGTVLVFIGDDCPISNSYAPEISRLAARCAARHLALTLVNTDTQATAAMVRRHGQEYGLHCLTLLDPARALAKYAGATVTPEAVVYAPDGTLVYRGRIDNKYVDFGKARPQATTHDLRDAVDAFGAGRPVARRETKAVGCYL